MTDESGMVYMVLEVGSPGDEGTMAAVFCRDYRHFCIGRNGGVTLLNPKEGKPVSGFPRVLYTVAR